jgi:hypothetical protein
MGVRENRTELVQRERGYLSLAAIRSTGSVSEIRRGTSPRRRIPHLDSSLRACEIKQDSQWRRIYFDGRDRVVITASGLAAAIPQM